MTADINVDTGSRSEYDREPLELEYSPELSDKYGWMFYEVAYNIVFLPFIKQVEKLNASIVQTTTAGQLAKRDEQSDNYSALIRNLAALLLLRDLLQIGWRMRLAGPKIYLRRPELDENITVAKQRVRDSMGFERRESLLTPAVHDFVRSMERRRIVQDRPRSILSLVAEGDKLYPLLKTAANLQGVERIEALKKIVDPYLQLVEGDTRDKFTDIRLYDIWRYFRLTWSTPYRSTPGRNVFYLIRDRKQECHPVIGIAALANCVIGLKSRDDQIGWTPDAVADELLRAKAVGDRKFRHAAWQIAELLEKHLENGIAAIATDGIATPHTIAHPTPEAIAEIEAYADEAAASRYDHLKQEAQNAEEFELELMMSETGDQPSQPRESKESSLALFRRKRAAKLANLLQAKLLMQKLNVFDNPVVGLPMLLWNDKAWNVKSDKGRSAIRTLLNANKESKIGTSMMEIIVCGAIAPYNFLLGGKLVAMLLTSPELIRDYEQRYGQQASTIASQVAGYDVTRPASIVYLGTSSLYTSMTTTNAESKSSKPSGASQYNRIKVPATIAGSAGEIAYKYIGATEGFGVVHFSADTRRVLEELDMIEYQAKRINSVFGEGTSPRLRKIRQGISLLGLDDRYLIHGQSRLIYRIDLAHNTTDYLCGRNNEPDYIFPLQHPKRTTKKIANYWIERWLSSRLNHAPSLEAVANFKRDSIAISREYHTAGQELPTDLGL